MTCHSDLQKFDLHFTPAGDRIKSAAVKKSEMLMSAHRQLRNTATKINREANMAYILDKLQASQGDLKKTWATIDKLVNKRSKTTNITALEADGQTIDNRVGMAISINDFLPRTEAGLSSTPCMKNIYGETISMHQKKPVFFLVSG